MSVPDSYGLSSSTGLPSRRPITTNLPVPERALAIGAHPDDVEFGCGGTLAKWASQGCEIFHLVLTDGSKGTWDPDVDQAELVVTRQREQRNAARALGGTSDRHVVFLGWIDGELDASLRQRWEVAYWIRQFKPTVVLGHDPWRRYRIHPDHRNAGFLTTDGIVAARDPKFFAEQNIAPHRPEALLLWEADEADHVEDIAGFIDQKVVALLAHESQYETTMRIDPSLPPVETSPPNAVGTSPVGVPSDVPNDVPSDVPNDVPDDVPDDVPNDQVGEFRIAVAERAREAGSLAGVAAGEAFKLITRL